MVFFETTEYIKWFKAQDPKTKYIIKSRLKRVEDDNHWGVVNKFDSIIELKWIFGLRIYTTRLNHLNIVLLIGGNKNGQSKDIAQAKKILKKIKKSYFK
jgi:putative addiction module killer protein